MKRTEPIVKELIAEDSGIDLKIPSNAFVATEENSDQIKFVPALTIPSDHKPIASINRDIANIMMRFSGCPFEKIDTNFSLCLPVGKLGDSEKYYRGGFGARHILVIPDHINPAHNYYNKNENITNKCESLLRWLQLIFSNINDAFEPDRMGKIALAWVDAENDGRFILAVQLPHPVGRFNHALCIFRPYSEDKFSITTAYPIEAWKFNQVKNSEKGYQCINTMDVLSVHRMLKPELTLGKKTTGDLKETESPNNNEHCNPGISVYNSKASFPYLFSRSSDHKEPPVKKTEPTKKNRKGKKKSNNTVNEESRTAYNDKFEETITLLELNNQGDLPCHANIIKYIKQPPQKRKAEKLRCMNMTCPGILIPL